MKTTLWALAAAVALGGAVVQPALAASPVKMGTLTCEVASGKKKLFQKTLNLTCVFTDLDGNTVGKYDGVVDRTGLSIGKIKSTQLVWIVGTLGDPDDNKLDGKYFGATAGATLGAGAGANYLTGLNGRISLQPLSVETMSGLGFDIAGQSLVLTEAKG